MIDTSADWFVLAASARHLSRGDRLRLIWELVRSLFFPRRPEPTFRLSAEEAKKRFGRLSFDPILTSFDRSHHTSDPISEAFTELTLAKQQRIRESTSKKL